MGVKVDGGICNGMRAYPTTVETQVRGEVAFGRVTNYGLGLNLHLVKARCSVACLEWC